MNGQQRTLAIAAVVVGVVACFPSACCLGFYGVSNFMVPFADPAMLEAAAGSAELPPPAVFVVLGTGSTLAALVALGLGLAGLVWGVRALSRGGSTEAAASAE